MRGSSLWHIACSKVEPLTNIGLSMLKFIISLGFLLIGAKVYSQEMHDEYFDLEGSRLHVKIYTPKNIVKSTPSILLESGGGMDSSQWKSLQPAIADQLGAVVISYDRPGFGESSLPIAPYDISKEVNDLHSILVKLGQADRVILVAHSYGGLLAQLYASKWPDSTAGAVLLEPNSPAALIALREFVVLTPAKNPETARAKAFARIDAATIDTFVQVYKSAIPNKIPLIVVSAATGLFPTQRANDAFRLTHQLIAKSVDDGKWIVAEGSNHNIPATNPAVVINSVAELSAKATGLKSQ